MEPPPSKHPRRDTAVVLIALAGALLSFLIPMPWGAIPAAITLTIACTVLVLSPRKRRSK